MTDNSLLEILSKGGYVMLPLALCSLISVALIIERSIFGPRRSRVIPEKLLAEINTLLDKKSFEMIIGICKENTSSLAKVVLAALNNKDKNREQIIEAVEVAGRKESISLLRYTNILGTIAAVSPLLGLLGTVFGMIQTFAVIQVQGVGDANALAGGISEALVSTASGLTIAIPSLIFYRYLQAQAKKLSIELEEIALKVTESL